MKKKTTPLKLRNIMFLKNKTGRGGRFVPQFEQQSSHHVSAKRVSENNAGGVATERASSPKHLESEDDFGSLPINLSTSLKTNEKPISEIGATAVLPRLSSQASLRRVQPLT